MMMNDIFKNLQDFMDISTQQEYYIGMMSGTSLDALDAVLCEFIDDKPIIIATHSEIFDKNLREILLALCTPNGTQKLAVGDFSYFSELDFWGLASRLYAEFASEVIVNLLHKTNISHDDIIAIGCHGQTVRHRPEWRFSLQLIDPNILAERTGIAVVSDFRRRDMAVGGQGAPLVPAFHQAMFGYDTSDDSSVIILNLGGIANITILGDTVTGYDTGAANLLMDGWITRHQGINFDKNGEWASSGTIHQPLLSKLLNHDFLKKSAPKSTGREEFNLEWLDGILNNFSPINPQDVQTTLCEFTAVTISQEIQKFAKNHNQLFVCGGGAYNTYLMNRLAYHLPNFDIKSTQAHNIEPVWIESLAFAWLARQNMLMQSGNLPAVTGADKEVVLGVVCF